MPGRSLIAALRDLCAGDIEFVVVGELAAALNGTPCQTLVIDLVCSRETANIDRLLTRSSESNRNDAFGPTPAILEPDVTSIC